ncbi:MAG: EamA family transporter [Deltaproteobacteria bacterium]|nr:EamA family transporter [Deltaproteobacteria bacterium]
MTSSKRAGAGYLMVLTAALLWASSGAVGKYLIMHGLSPISLVQIRCLGASILLAFGFVAARRADLFRIRPSDILYFVLLGGGFMALVQVAYFSAISEIPVAAAILLQYLSTILVVTYSVLFWRESFGLSMGAALVLALGGCFLVVGGYDLSLLEMNTTGIIWGLVAAVSFAGYTLVGEKGLQRYSPWTMLLYTLAFAAVTCHSIYPDFSYLRVGFSTIEWFALFHVAALGTAVSFGLYFVGIGCIRSSRASIAATSEPVFAGLLAYVILGESMAALQMLGGALVIGAIILLQRGRDKGEPSSS